MWFMSLVAPDLWLDFDSNIGGLERADEYKELELIPSTDSFFRTAMRLFSILPKTKNN